MGDGVVEFSESGRTMAAFIPPSHRHLPMLRLFLPFVDRSGNIVRWSRYVDVEEQSASVDWFKATADAAAADPDIRDLASSMGVLDETTAAAVTDAIGELSLHCLRWVGNGETPTSGALKRVFGEEYFEGDLSPGDVQADRRIPEFAWDADGRLAWGARLYPDSLVIAAELSLFRQLRNDTRLDTASARADRDVLPRSAGD